MILKLGKVYNAYKHSVYPRISNLRGSHFLKRNLESLCLKSLPQSDEDQVDKVSEMEWDNLILMDACRYDKFKEVIGSCDKRISAGSNSCEFLRENFSEPREDIVYVSANPHLHESQLPRCTGMKPKDNFFAVYKLFEDSWNEKEGTVMPREVTKAAKSAKKLFPDKKLVVHYIQPHNPFIGLEIDTDALEKFTVVGESGKVVYDYVERGEMEPSKVIEGYEKNLELVYSEILRLAESIEGETLVTSDHGELLGEGGLWDHPPRNRVKYLREVPVIRNPT